MIEEILIPYISGRFASEPSYREGHVRIVNPLPGVPVLGLHIPDMKKIAKELAAGDGMPAMLEGFETARLQGRACIMRKSSSGALCWTA